MPALSLHIESTDSMRLYDKVMQTAEALYSVNCGKLNQLGHPNLLQCSNNS